MIFGFARNILAISLKKRGGNALFFDFPFVDYDK